MTDAAAAARTALRRLHRLRRAVLVRRIRAIARANNAAVDIDIAHDVRLGRRLRVLVEPGSRNVLHIARGCSVGDDVVVMCKGGRILIGPWCDIRRGVVLNVAGRLELAGENVLSWGVVVHCANSIRLARKALVGDYASIVDSSHYYTEPDVTMHANVAVGEVEIGYNSWLAAKATVTRNSRVGAHCIVAANSVVVGDVPDGHLASGVPATCRPLSLPWHNGSA